MDPRVTVIKSKCSLTLYEGELAFVLKLDHFLFIRRFSVNELFSMLSFQLVNVVFYLLCG